jgi:hypothetical protein
LEEPHPEKRRVRMKRDKKIYLIVPEYYYNAKDN